MRISRTGLYKPEDVARVLNLDLATVTEILLPVLRRCEARRVHSTLEHVNKILDQTPPWSYGVETIRDPRDAYAGTVLFYYINRGDAYDGTVLYDTEKEVFIIASWGDVIETNKQYQRWLKEHEKANGE